MGDRRLVEWDDQGYPTKSSLRRLRRLLGSNDIGVEPDEELGVAVEVDGFVWICQPAVEWGWVAVTALRADRVGDIRQYLRQLQDERQQAESLFNQADDPELIDTMAYRIAAIELEQNRVYRQLKQEMTA